MKVYVWNDDASLSRLDVLLGPMVEMLKVMITRPSYKEILYSLLVKYSFAGSGV